MMARQSSSTPPRSSAAAWLAVAALYTPAISQAESLKDAWSMAVGSDQTLAAVRSEREAAESERTAAERQRWPALDLVGSYTQLDHAPLLDISTPAGQLQAPIWKRDGYAMATADVSVPLWTSGRIRGSIGAAAAAVRGAAAQESRSTADLKLIVTESYVAVFRARKTLQVAETSVASLSAHARDVQAMYDKEAVARSDLLAAQVALAQAEQQRLRAANALHLSTAAYNRWVGQPLDRTPELEEPSLPSVSLDSASLDQLTHDAFERRPELTAASAMQSAFEEAARAERAKSLPQVAVHAGFNHLDNQILDRQNFASIGIGFQWRLFDSGELTARTRALHSRAHAADLKRGDLRSMIALEVEQAFYNRDEAAARIKVATGAVVQAEEDFRIARELYGSGLGTNNQVLDAETRRIAALTNRDDANFDLIIARYRLQRAIGEL
jgi:outer membrane protein TolC